MSVDNDTSFSISYNGKFETINGELMYVGGNTHYLQTSAQAFYSGIRSAEIVNLHGQRMWYKLPFEELKDLKLLCDGSENFQNMCKAASWTRTVEIYMEHENSHNKAGHGGNSRQNDAVNSSLGQNHYACHEGARVEEIVAGFVDEEEDNDDFRNTPPTSDFEEEETAPSYERWKRGSGELKVMQLFESVKEFKEAVLEYALKGGWNIKYTRWGNVKGEAKCAVEGDIPCHWRIYCSFEEYVGLWMVKTFQEEHSCTKDGYCKLLTDAVIANIFINDIRKDPELMPKIIQDQIQDRYNLQVTHDICRKGRKRALELIKDEYDEQFIRIKDYKNQILISNPGSTVDLRTTTRDDGQEEFDRFYLCFAASRQIWRTFCRPIFGIDGCFLKSNTKGQLLAAVGRDANNQIYPVAWAVVQVENTDTWEWFIEKLKKDLDLHNGDGFTLISDKQKGLVKAVQQELPNVEHRMCARHTYGNLKKVHSCKPQMKKLFWIVSDSYNKADYEAALKNLKAYDVDVYDSLMMRNPMACSRAFFRTTSHCEDALNNFSESYNSALEKARSLPLVEMLETMRRQAMIRIELRRNKANKHKGLFSLKVAKMISAEEKEKKWCKRIPGPNGSSEVSEKGTSYAVDIGMRTCSCRKWDVTGIPCRHALKIFMDKKLNAEDYVSHWYLTSIWRRQYDDSITPVEGMKFWKTSGEPTLEAPPRDVSKGRKKNPQKRMKSITESPTKGKKVTKHTRVIHCYRCGFAGHNASKCSYTGVPFKPRKKRQKAQPNEDAFESISLDFGEGPSQPTQD